MSKFYRKSNSESTKDLYEKKLVYDLTARTKTSRRSLVDYTFAEKALYGRVDRTYVPIKFSDHYIQLKNIKSKGDGLNIRTLPFVADAFDDLANLFLKKVSIDEISKSEQYLTKLVAHEAYVSPIKKYDEYSEMFIEAIGAIIRGRKIYFQDFQDFIQKIMPNIIEAIPKYPITMPGFVKSRHCPIFCTGLAIKISDISFDNDAKKIKEFYESRNWGFYVNAAANYGFTIDKNNPSILVADIAAAEMLAYAEPYDLLSTDSVLNGAYRPAHEKAIEQLRAILFTIYNRFRVKRYSVHTQIMPNKYMVKHISPRHYTYDQFKEEVSDLAIIEMYCKFRIKEEESKFSASEKHAMIRDTLEIASNDIPKALRCFEIILNKTFDYRGSLSYYKMRMDLLGQ